MSDLVGKGFTFGLRQIVLQSADELTVIELDAGRTLTFSEEFINDELLGNDRVVAVATFPKKLTWELEGGGLQLEALALMFGETITTSGVTPNRIEEMVRSAGTVSPYFTIMGRSVTAGSDAVHVIIPMAKVTGYERNAEQEAFGLMVISGEAIDDGSGLYVIRKLETDASLI